ncbi:hypothetical protein HU200_065040 [Digitaria exilis]|uniref:RING-type E3 ubiquitin transferase n=1 Tax=Digitaria exilis TaxID=1010633 RepID=A0A834ZZ18_9POAL|nr:hypothetical protein HU200_065040 [Digitaria exilis]
MAAAAAAGVRRAGGRFRRARWEVSNSGAGGYFLGGGSDGLFSRVVLEEALSPAPGPDVDVPATAGRDPSPPSPSAAASRITPAVLFVTVVLAVVLLVSGLLHVLRRLFLKTRAGAGERQLQHLFFPGAGGGGHDDGSGGSGCGGGGLSQAAIDALPEFAYGELSGAAVTGKGKEKAPRPFDCAVCLCEFADHDRLRLLPTCGHAFHLACIDVWLRSSATCPLCRTKLTPRHLAAAASAEAAGPDVEEQKQEQEQEDHQGLAAASSSVVLPVRLGRFRSADGEASTGDNTSRRIEAGRRSYSMGSYQYVLADEHLLVSVHMRHGNNAGGVAAASDHQQQQQGKKVFARGDSFSVSKVWQWRGSKRLPVSLLCGDDGLPPWAPPAKDQAAGTYTRQPRHGDT